MQIEAREKLRARMMLYQTLNFIPPPLAGVHPSQSLLRTKPYANMRPTQALFRRIRNFQLTTKQGPKDYYKGTGSGRMGDHTKYGGYIVNYDRVRTYCVPQNLDSFKVCLKNSYGSGVRPRG